MLLGIPIMGCGNLYTGVGRNDYGAQICAYFNSYVKRTPDIWSGGLAEYKEYAAQFQ